MKCRNGSTPQVTEEQTNKDSREPGSPKTYNRSPKTFFFFKYYFYPWSWYSCAQILPFDLQSASPQFGLLASILRNSTWLIKADEEHVLTPFEVPPASPAVPVTSIVRMGKKWDSFTVWQGNKSHGTCSGLLPALVNCPKNAYYLRSSCQGVWERERGEKDSPSPKS